MTPTISAMREIGIDAGHRVTNHGSKCRNIHGHRYTIQVSLTGVLVQDGEEEGMVMDFGFLKNLMMEEIDEPCDHGLILWVEDPLLLGMIGDEVALCREEISVRGYSCTKWAGGKLYVIGKVPTAENLAEHWYERLRPLVHGMTEGRARVSKVVVWETPNCATTYEP